MRRFSATLWLAAAMAVTTTLAQTPTPSRPGPQSPTRDTSARQGLAAEPQPPAGRITGRVLAADTGRPVKRARVLATAAELPEGRGALTDNQGVFDLPELPAGRYTVRASKSGFVGLSFGQRRPYQGGIPLQLGDGQQLKGVDFRLPRGSVVAGHIYDEDGDPMPGVTVRVMRYQYLQGERRLTPAGAGQADDKGQYRVWGLMPGNYYISAFARNFNFTGPGRGPSAAPGAGSGGPGPPPGPSGSPSSDDEESLAYAPTFYPGVASVVDAKPIIVGLSEEVLDINFNLQLVHASRISGHVTNPDGTATTSGLVNLLTDAAAGRSQIGANFGGRIEWDGSFEILNVPPGRYVLRARGTDTETPQFAVQPLTVSGQDIDDVPVILMPGAQLSGTVTVLPGTSPSPDITNIRVTAPATDQEAGGPQQRARVDRDGHFTLDGVAAGSHLIRADGNLRGWLLRSVTVDGRDVTDTPIALRSGQAVNDVAIVLSDSRSEITGTVTDGHGAPLPDFTVLAFPTDPSLWRPLSRHIMTARPDQTGKYRIRGLPPGEYYLATVDPVEQGEWFEPAYLDEHRAGAAHVTLSDGDSKSQNFRVSGK